MLLNKKILAIIPARKGSKGLKNKNILPIAGKPLITWSIEQALNSKVFDTIIVSTDSIKIARVARSAGVNVPFIRPNYLARDNTSSVKVILHCLKILEDQNKIYDIVALLEPTSPLRDVSDIKKSLRLLISTKKAEAIVSVCKCESTHPDNLFLKSKNKKLIPFRKTSGKIARRQDLSEVFFPEGTIYASKIPSFLKNKTFYQKNTIGYEVPRYKSIEIDEKWDFICAESILKKY